jgi:pyruvate/2-oxoglutarate dehydrogenase complex dihydrolipoamide acyltransferase (E2) component
MTLQRIPNKNIMIVFMKRLRLPLLILTLLSGCEALGPLNKPAAPQPAPAKPAPPRPAPAPVVAPPVVAAPAADQVALREGIDLYNKGLYNEAIKRLAAPEIAAGSKANQVAAAKYSAFSYCVTSRQTLCRQQFDKAFKLDPAFDLQPGEHGHPLWGPAFTRVKKSARPK